MLELNQHILQILESTLKEINSITFSESFGLAGFELDDIIQFYKSPEQFDLRLKRDPFKERLYGLRHIELRQQLFNKLPNELRLVVLKKKLEYFNLFTPIQKRLGLKTTLTAQDIKTVRDIGAGHSIYLIRFRTGQEIVIKKQNACTNPYPEFYCDILKQLDWPTYWSKNIDQSPDYWEISEFMDPDSFIQALKAETTQSNPDFLTQLAQHAALGDLLGRGDRHFENYVMKNKNVVPIDIHYLFDPNNDNWVLKYISAGLYEVNYLVQFMADADLFSAKLNFFLDQYQTTLHYIKKRAHLIQNSIADFFGHNPEDCQKKLTFVQSRLESITPFFNLQSQNMLLGLLEMVHRLPHKYKLEELAHIIKAPDFADDELKMYYYANTNRFSCFFKIDKQKKPLFERIDTLYTDAHKNTPTVRISPLIENKLQNRLGSS